MKNGIFHLLTKQDLRANNSHLEETSCYTANLRAWHKSPEISKKLPFLYL